jgi:SAM-dependent methyltransferase
MSEPPTRNTDDQSGHINYYRQNQAYTQTLVDRETHLFDKYADALKTGESGARVLDVGCGAGQVVEKLARAGYDAWGVDVSETNVRQARDRSPNCRLYDGSTLPFPADHFAAAGALNVLEHVDHPEAFIRELVRVVRPGGTVVLSSPNFFRAIGFRDYHPRMRGIANKWRNWGRLRAKRRQIREKPADVRFDRMVPIVKEPFTPDDDAVVATNGVEMAFFLQQASCRILSVACTDRYVNGLAERVLNGGPWRFLMFNAFVRAVKDHAAPSDSSQSYALDR